MRYGKKVQKNKALSHMPEDPFLLPDDEHVGKLKLERKHVLIIITATILFATILYAVQTMGWGLIEMTGGFFLVGVATILLSGMTGPGIHAFNGPTLRFAPCLPTDHRTGIYARRWTFQHDHSNQRGTYGHAWPC